MTPKYFLAGFIRGPITVKVYVDKDHIMETWQFSTLQPRTAWYEDLDSAKKALRNFKRSKVSRYLNDLHICELSLRRLV